jgi:hypothetical protein
VNTHLAGSQARMSGGKIMQQRPSTLEQGLDMRAASAPSPIGRLLSLITPPPAPASASFDARERVRRGRLVGALLLAFTLIELAALVQFVVVDDDHPLMKITLVVTLALTVIVAALNRFGRVTLAGLLLVALANLPLASIPATAIDGKFDVVDLGALYLAAGSVLVAASVLEPWSVFAVAAINCARMTLIIVGMPHSLAFDQLLASNNAQQAFAGPLLMQVVVALVAYFWARSVLSALKRADRAEEIAALERRELERTHELEQGVRELLAVHVLLANGDFQARAQPIHNPLLWQIGASLNTLIARFARLAQMDFLLRRTDQEARRLAESIRIARAGRQPIWPAPSGTPLDEVILALTDTTSYAAPANAAPHGFAPSPAPNTSSARSEANLPEWPFA